MKVLSALILFSLIMACSGRKYESRMDQSPVLIYLHGMIIENQGVNATHPEYGNYEYENILQTFRDKGFRVISEARPKDTEVFTYADKVAGQVRELISSGVDPENITITGASKGSMIAMIASARLQNEQVNFVFMAACNEWAMENLPTAPCGRILSIYEKTDELGKSCKDIIDKSNCRGEFQEIEINTGKKHGFLFKPMEAWVEPVVLWATTAGNIEE